MKNLYSCIIIIILTFFTSCDDIDTNVIDAAKTVSDATENQTGLTQRMAGEIPANSDNPYENAGKVYDQMLTAYYTSGSFPSAVSGVCDKVKSISDATADYNSLKGNTYRDVQQERVSYIISHPNTCLTDITNATGLSVAGKSSLTTFVNSVLQLNSKESEFKPIYDYICDYESSILLNTMLTAKDRKVILIVTSVSRYSINKVKKHPKKNTDPDWTILIGNMTGAIYGADNDTGEGISTALACGVSQN